MKTLAVNPRFAKTLRPQNKKETEIFAKHLDDGILPTPIIYWFNPATEQNEIIDGHHRYAYAMANALEFETFEMHFINESQAEAWIIYHQFSQRNVDDWAVSGYLQKAIALTRDNNPSLTKTEIVKQVAESAGVSERAVWRADAEEKPPNPVQTYKTAKAELERKLTIAKTKAVEKLKQKAVKENLTEDEAMAEWETIEAAIDAEYQDEISELDSLGQVAQQAVEDNPGLKRAGEKRPTKKSTKDRAARRNTFKKALSLIGKLKNEAFYFWTQNGCGDVSIAEAQQALTALAVQISNAQDADAKAAKKRKFGGK